MSRAPEISVVPRVLGVLPGDPDDPLTWSGAGLHLLAALRHRGALVGAVDARPAPLELLEKAASLDRSRTRWHQRFAARSSPLSPVARRVRGRYTSTRIRRLDVAADAVLQVGGWCHPNAYAASPGALRSSYHDGNLATFLRRPGLRLDPSSRAVRRAWNAERRLYDAVDLILPMSDWLRMSFIEDFGQDPGKVVTVGGGANFTTLPTVPVRDHTHPRLLFVGKGDFPRKGGPELLEAFRAVRAARPEAELWIVGQPLPARAPDGVTFHGRILRDTAAGEAAIDRLYREATAFVMPSRYEPFGLVFLEAMAYGLPCVATDTCAMPELVGDGTTGRVVPVGAADALAEAILAIIDDPAAAAAMGAAGRLRLQERFTWDAVALRMLDAMVKARRA